MSLTLESLPRRQGSMRKALRGLQPAAASRCIVDASVRKTANANSTALKKVVFRLGELFCGPGGLAYGATHAKAYSHSGAEYSVCHAWATDYDLPSCKTYAHNICNGDTSSVVCADIRELDFMRLKAISDIDALAFGFPCNDFSMVGEQKGVNGAFGPLYQYCVKALEAFHPKWFLAENVGGLQSANDGKAFARVLKAMYDAGYSIFPHYYSFDRYGVPQARQRIIMVGIRRDLNLYFEIPSPAPFEHVDVSARTALECPPISDDMPNTEKTKQSADVIERLKHIKPGENAFTAKLPPHLELQVKGAKISQIYKKLNPDRPAYTVTGSGGGGTHMYHWKENRALTNRERARLQTFPDAYEFMGSKEEVRKQIGMAVPCMGAQVIFEAILNTFAKVDYPAVKSKFPPLVHPRDADCESENGVQSFLSVYEKGLKYEV